jgi:hypothetical protein
MNMMKQIQDILHLEAQYYDEVVSSKLIMSPEHPQDNRIYRPQDSAPYIAKQPR